jgi:DNA excision repair protein ERCC-5
MCRLHGESNIPEKYTYYDELETSAAVETLRKKHKMDQFELPEVQENETDARLRKLDPRLATSEEIQDFVNEYKPTEQDIDSEEFQALPPEIQYEVIQDMMWKSRSTSWARLDEMVRGSNTALDFSKHQIKLLKHRNAMTQRLMQASSAQSGIKVEPARIAGERGRQYILYKNEDLNQGLGWKLPGLTAAEPVNLDDTTTLRPEPKLEVPDEKER